MPLYSSNKSRHDRSLICSELDISYCSMERVAEFFLHILIVVGPLIYARGECNAAGDGLALLTSCVCPGQNIIYQCSIMGEGATLWQGDALDCELVILHTQLLGSSSQKCSNGAQAFPIGAVDNCFTSWLNVTVNVNMNNTSVICAYDNGTRVVVGNETLKFTSDPFPPDSIDLQIISVHNQVTLAFSWNQSMSNGCPSETYDIFASNCGRCPTMTNTSSVTCNDTIANLNGAKCSFTVQAIICGNIRGSRSTTIDVNLAVPNIPMFTALPLTHTRILTLTFEMDTFNATTRIDGSVTSYSIFYADAESGRICGSAIIARNACQGGICCHFFNVILSFCPHANKIAITLFATNILGDGPISLPFIVTLSNLTRNNEEDKCNCSCNSQFCSTNLGISLAASLLLFLTVIFIIVIIVQAKDRVRIQALLKTNSMENRREAPVYEEINLDRITNEPEAKKNIAYGHILKQTTTN